MKCNKDCGRCVWCEQIRQDAETIPEEDIIIEEWKYDND